MPVAKRIRKSNSTKGRKPNGTRRSSGRQGDEQPIPDLNELRRRLETQPKENEEEKQQEEEEEDEVGVDDQGKVGSLHVSDRLEILEIEKTVIDLETKHNPSCPGYEEEPQMDLLELRYGRAREISGSIQGLKLEVAGQDERRLLGKLMLALVSGLIYWVEAEIEAAMGQQDQLTEEWRQAKQWNKGVELKKRKKWCFEQDEYLEAEGESAEEKREREEERQNWERMYGQE